MAAPVQFLGDGILLLFEPDRWMLARGRAHKPEKSETAAVAELMARGGGRPAESHGNGRRAA